MIRYPKHIADIVVRGKRPGYASADVDPGP